jgi:hypothetical protein
MRPHFSEESGVLFYSGVSVLSKMMNYLSLARFALYTLRPRASLKFTEVTGRFKEEGLLFVPSGNKQKHYLSVTSAISVRDKSVRDDLILASFASLR